MLRLLESLLSGRFDHENGFDKKSNQSNAHIDLNTLVAILNSSKVPPKLTSELSDKTGNYVSAKTTNASDQIQVNVIESTQSSTATTTTTTTGSKPPPTNKLMNSLIHSYLNQSFESSSTTSRLRAATAMTSGLSNRKGPVLTDAEAEKENEDDKEEEETNAKELFTRYTKSSFLSLNGICVILNECNASLTYLNMYRKSHYKQAINQSTFAVTDTISSDGEEAAFSKAHVFNLIEDALQVKAK